MRLRLAWAGLMVVAVITVPGAPATAAESDPCALAAANAAAGQLTAAIGLYQTQFNRNQPCAVSALPALLQKRADVRQLIDGAKNAQELGNKPLALEKTVAALELDPSSPEAAKLLGSLTDAAGQYDVATKLDKAGYHSAAETLARSIAAETNTAIPESLTKPEESSAEFATRWSNNFNSWLDAITSFLPFLLVLFVIVLYLLRHARRPQVVFETFESQEPLCAGEVLASVLISEITTAGSGRQLERVADKSTTEAINVEGLVGDRAKWIAALLQYVGMKRQVRVSGFAFKANDHEVVISITITKPNRVVSDSRTFTNADPDKEPEILIRELVHDAAAWTLFRLHFLVVRYGIRGIRAHFNRDQRHDPYCLGTEDWRSWGRFRRAVWRETQGLPDARDAYLESVEYDPNNWGAWLNLASLDTRARPRVAIARLDTARALIKSKPRKRVAARDHGEPELEPAYYRLLYLLGIAHLNRSVEPGNTRTDQEAEAQAAQEVGTELVCTLAKTKLRLLNRRKDQLKRIKPEKRRDLTQTIALVQTTGIAMLASAKVNAGMKINYTLPRFGDPTAHDQHETQLKLEKLAPDASPDLLVESIGGLLAPQQLSPGTNYNLACLYARALRPHHRRRSDDLTAPDLIDAALRHLVCAVESGDRGALAATDAAFSELRARAPGRFKRITEQHISSASTPKREPEPAASGPERTVRPPRKR